VGVSDDVEAKISPGTSQASFRLASLTPYFVICETSSHYKVTDQRATTAGNAEAGKTGYVLKTEVYPWPTGEAFRLDPSWFNDASRAVPVWFDEATVTKFYETGSRRLYPPAFEETRTSLSKRAPSLRFYPALSSRVVLLVGKVEKRSFEVLVPSVIPPETGGGASRIVHRRGFILENSDFMEPHVRVDQTMLDNFITILERSASQVPI
jgi:hypothetical protein